MLSHLLEAMRVTRQARRQLLIATSAPAAIVTALMLLPKNAAFAANSRFAMTNLALGATTAGCMGATHAWRRYRDARFIARFARAPSAMRDTAGFLLQERSVGRRGRAVALAGVCAGTSLWVLGQWPQLAPLGPFRNPGAVLACMSSLALLFQPFRMRRHLINGIYLRRYLRQQARHIGFVPASAKTVCGREPAVTMTGPLSFRAGGFDWSFDDAVKNVLVIGQPGSGKTICVLNALLEAMLACGGSGNQSAGLILDPKGTYRDVIAALCARLGRTNDLYILSEQNWPDAARTQHSIALNPTDTDEDALEIGSRFSTTQKLAGGLRSQDTFFPDSARSFVRHAFALLRQALAPEPASVIDIHRLCGEAVEESHYYNFLTARLAEKYSEASLPADVAAAVEYFETEWRPMSERQLSGVRSSVKQLLDDFTVEPIADMVSGKSTLRLHELVDQGKILYVHLPLAGRERLARILTTLIRLEFQREILRRPRKTRPSFLFADEFQSLFVAGEEHGDSDFFERSRESLHANIVAAQNMSSFLKKTGNRNDVLNFLGLCAVKIFLRNSERETNEWASQLFGERSEIIVTASEAARLDGGLSRSQTSYSRSTQNRRVVPPGEFAALAVPVAGDPAQRFTESIVQLGSRPVVAMQELLWPVHPLP